MMSFLNHPGWNEKFLSWFGFVMVLTYIAAGIFFVTESAISGLIQPEWRIPLGVLFLSYGTFRAIRIIKKRQNNSGELDDEK